MATSKTRPRRVKVPGEPHIYERPGRKPRVFEIMWRDSSGRQHVRTAKGGIMAVRTERDRILGDRARGVTPAVPRLTFGTAATAWLEALELTGRDPKTVAERQRHVETVLSGWHTRRLDEIVARDVLSLLKRLRREGLGARSQTIVLNTIKRVYAHAASKLHWRGPNPLDGLESWERPEHHAPEHVIFKQDELAETLAAAREPYRTIFYVLAGTGCRIAEALGLAPSDLYLGTEDDPHITFRCQLARDGTRKYPKRGSRGTVWISADLAGRLQSHMRRNLDRGIGSEFVFATGRDTPLGHRNVHRELRRAQKAARRPDGTPTFPSLHEPEHPGRGVLPSSHSFRHTLASRMSAEGFTSEEIASQLRHKDGNVTRAVYIHELGDQARRRVQRDRIARLLPELEDEAEAKDA
jgi:integrase